MCQHMYGTPVPECMMTGVDCRLGCVYPIVRVAARDPPRGPSSGSARRGAKIATTRLSCPPAATARVPIARCH